MNERPKQNNKILKMWLLIKSKHPLILQLQPTNS
jgi:hypothetical protein